MKIKYLGILLFLIVSMTDVFAQESYDFMELNEKYTNKEKPTLETQECLFWEN